jgi:hypothetical protein
MYRKISAKARACAAHCIIAEGERLQVITLFLVYRCHLLKHIASTTAYALQEGKRNMLCFNVQATFMFWMLFYKQKWTKTVFTVEGQECAGVYHSCSFDDKHPHSIPCQTPHFVLYKTPKSCWADCGTAFHVLP